MNLARAHSPRTRHPATTAVRRRFTRFLVTVDFEQADGRQWSSVGGGETISEALESARAGLVPEWEVVRWNHTYGV